jgi:hypothetical protein
VRKKQNAQEKKKNWESHHTLTERNKNSVEISKKFPNIKIRTITKSGIEHVLPEIGLQFSGFNVEISSRVLRESICLVTKERV